MLWHRCRCLVVSRCHSGILMVCSCLPAAATFSWHCRGKRGPAAAWRNIPTQICVVQGRYG